LTNSLNSNSNVGVNFTEDFMERPQLSDEVLLKTIEAMTVAMGRKIERHGRGAYMSNHEALGIITEEYHELIDAVQSNDPVEVANETMDVAVGCLFALASQIEKEERIKAAQAELEAITQS
jgi:hypothetical protein